jgi:hypothetical protein
MSGVTQRQAAAPALCEEEPALGSLFLLHGLDVLATVTIEDVNLRQPF